jgi:hypothetical protein
MLIKTIPFLVFFVVLVFLPTGCAGSPPPAPDFSNIASAFKFVGCCSVICALLWAAAIIHNSNSRKGGR